MLCTTWSPIHSPVYDPLAPSLLTTCSATCELTNAVSTSVNYNLFQLRPISNMLPAVSQQVVTQLGPVLYAAAAARSWTGSRLFGRSFSAEAALPNIQEVKTAEEFEAIHKHLAETSSVGIIDFTAKWCGPCKAIAPIYEELSQKYPQVKFLKIDIDNQDMQSVVNDHMITGVPTFTMYKGARKVENFTGARVDLLRSVLQKHAS